MSPTELLDAANSVLNRPELGLGGAWPRAVALIGRQALEEGLDQFWDGELAQMKDASRRTQTLCLNQFMRDPELSDGIKEAWSSLTRACHHHPYELSPTASELKNWLEEVEALLMQLGAATARSEL